MSAQITLEERYAIMALKKRRYSIRAIARGLGRAPSTVSRELKRNRRQHLPRRRSMAHVTQADLDAIAAKLNTRPRKRLGYRTPEECYA